MKDHIANLSNERLEDCIAKVYQEAERESPGIRLRETGILWDLWAEFDQRYIDGRINRDTE